MNIIDKLEIKPIERYDINDMAFNNAIDMVCLESEAAELEQQRNEMLEEWIEEWQFIEHFLACHADLLPPCIYDDFLIRQHVIEKIIEKATDKTWEEIKDLIK